MKQNNELDVIVSPLLAWLTTHRRPLPWRQSPTPYHVWISEIMLQQTRIEAVIPYYERFIRELPDVKALASVDDERLMKLWQGLGYYSRARNLKKAALTVMEKHGGALPADVDALRALSGIGDYTAGAVASIAFGLPEPAVDGNVLRVIMRFLGCESDVMLPTTKKRTADMLREIYPEGEDAKGLTEAIMELGESVCVPSGTPHCEDCPLAHLCRAHADGRETTLPVRLAKKQKRQERLTVLLLMHEGRTVIRKRKPTGLLASLWEFPNVPYIATAEEAWQAAEALGLCPLTASPAPNATHVFTHVIWDMNAFVLECQAPPENGELLLVSADEIRQEYAIPTAFRTYEAFALALMDTGKPTDNATEK